MEHALAANTEAFKILVNITQIIAVIVIITITVKLFYSKLYPRPGYIASNDYYENEYPEVTVDINTPTIDYKKRINMLLTNAKGERRAIEILQEQIDKLTPPVDYPNHAKEQLEKQLQDIEKYIRMFEKLQDKRKTGQLDNQTKHVLDPVWN